MGKALKKKNRYIKIKCDFAAQIKHLFEHFSTQLSDGYWESKEYYPDIWNCFEFSSEGCDTFVIILKNEPTWEEANADCEKFHTMKDEEIADYLRTAILDSIEDYPNAFDFVYSEYMLNIMADCIKKWNVLPPPLPKLTHKELVKIVGYDFEYIK